MQSPIALALLTALQFTPPAPVEQLVPSTKWAIDYADSQCRLSRAFGSGNERVVMGILSTPGQSYVELAVIEPGRPLDKATAVDFAIAAPSIKTEEARAMSVPMKEGGRITSASIQRDQLGPLQSATSITLTIGDRKATLTLPGMPAAMTALSNCDDDLLRQWGIDPLVHKRISMRAAPAGSPPNWLTDMDYPSGPLARGEQGSVMFAFNLDATGKIQECRILQSSGYPELDAPVCNVMRKRARFKPARDADGVALPSLFVSRFTWRIPH